jgi:predicted PurR-regulated permease PerM
MSATLRAEAVGEATDAFSADASPWRRHLPFAVWGLLAFACLYTVYFARALVRAIPRLHDKKRAVDIARETERQVSTYLFTLSWINAGLGIAVAVTMGLIGLPNPALWGVIAAVLSYVPVFGGIVTGAVLLLAGTLTFDSLWLALLPVLAFAVLNFAQDYVVTPLVMGRRLMLNPIVLFTGVVFWWWLWGVPGSLLAVPMIATFKIICDRTEGLKPIGELIEGGK